MKIKKTTVFYALSISAIAVNLFYALSFGWKYVVRFCYSIADFVTSIVIYFERIILQIEPNVPATVTDHPTWELKNYLSFDFDTLVSKLEKFFPAFFNGENFKSYLGKVSEDLYSVAVYALIFVPVVLLVVNIVKDMILTENIKGFTAKETKSIKFFNNKIYPFYLKARDFFIEFRYFLQGKRKWFVRGFVFLSLVVLNVLSIVVEFFAFYFYFASNFNFADFPLQLHKLVMDLLIMFFSAPVVFWLCVAAIVLCIVRKYIAKQRLYHFERLDERYIDKLPIVSMLVGPMGVSKTTLVTDMAITQSEMFRDKALDKMITIRHRFKFFDFDSLEFIFQLEMRSKQINNLAKVRQWVKKQKAEENFFGYDYLKYGDSYDNGLVISEFYDVVSTYLQLYFIYSSDSPLLYGNFSIRDDSYFDSLGNFPLWRYDYFSAYSVTDEDITHHSHIIDFDALRPGKKIRPDSQNYGSFEYGVLYISEVGKERGNNLELRETKKNTDTVNQKNDLFNQFLKMCRHSSTIDNYPFVKVFTDEQRPESWGADARDLSQVLHVVRKESVRLAMPFFFLGNFFNDFFFSKWLNFYTELIYYRNNDNLFTYLLRLSMAKFFNHYEKIYNRYGYHRVLIEKENGVLDGEREKGYYYLMSKKIYSNRFATDCFQDYYNRYGLSTPNGLITQPEYQSYRATVEELLRQNSYFIKSIFNDKDQDDQ